MTSAPITNPAMAPPLMLLLSLLGTSVGVARGVDVVWGLGALDWVVGILVVEGRVGAVDVVKGGSGNGLTNEEEVGRGRSMLPCCDGWTN